MVQPTTPENRRRLMELLRREVDPKGDFLTKSFAVRERPPRTMFRSDRVADPLTYKFDRGKDVAPKPELGPSPSGIARRFEADPQVAALQVKNATQVLDGAAVAMTRYLEDRTDEDGPPASAIRAARSLRAAGTAIAALELADLLNADIDPDLVLQLNGAWARALRALRDYYRALERDGSERWDPVELELGKSAASAAEIILGFKPHEVLPMAASTAGFDSTQRRG